MVALFAQRTGVKRSGGAAILALYAVFVAVQIASAAT